MKALGMKLLDRVLYMSQIGLITPEERVEYARIIQGGMLPNHNGLYRILRDKLTDKCDNAATQGDEQRYLYDTISLIDQSISI